MHTIVVVDYDPAWPTVFEQLRAHVWPVVQEVAVTIEHVGSTSVPGLAAKPIIDIDVIVASEHEVPLAIERIASLGYVPLGNSGVEGREAFDEPDEWPDHNLYVCPKDNLGLRNHLAVRDYLRTHPETVQVYGDLKKQLARTFPQDMTSYIDGKTDLIQEILRQQGLSPESLVAIERINRKP